MTEVTKPAVQLVLDYRKCCGCRICEVACSVRHFGEFNPELSRIRVYDFYNGVIQVPSICWGCRWAGEEAFCVDACPVPGALSWYQGQKKLNVPVVDEKLCTQCLLCVDACRAKAMKINPGTGFPMVCNRCDGEPECVKVCPTGALESATTPTTMERFYGSDSPEEIAEKMKNHMFYPWKGLEDWKD